MAVWRVPLCGQDLGGRPTVITQVEHNRLGANPRYVVTNLAGEPRALYKDLYRARRDMENRVKAQFDLFADRTSCHKWWPDQFRLG